MVTHRIQSHVFVPNKFMLSNIFIIYFVSNIRILITLLDIFIILGHIQY